MNDTQLPSHCVTQLPSYFRLQAGESVLVPPWFKKIILDSVRASEFADTPQLMHFEVTGDPFCTFVQEQRDQSVKVKRSRCLFVPGNLVVGDVLVIEWVSDDRRTAKAVHKKDYREPTKEPESKPAAPNYRVPNCS